MSTTIFHMIEGAPRPVAPYSHVVEVDGWFFVTGQLATGAALDPLSMPVGIEAQTHKVMQNLRTVLAGVGLGLEHVVCARVFLTHFEQDYEGMNRVYAGYFSENKRPARTCVGVTALAAGGRVEIDLIARAPARRKPAPKRKRQ
jgi:2-iminobutanoate/2-iminopropanoate deaminase